MNEDRCRVRADARPLASIRNLALAIMKGTRQSLPAARETFAADTALALTAVTGRIFLNDPGRCRARLPQRELYRRREAGDNRTSGPRIAPAGLPPRARISGQHLL